MRKIIQVLFHSRQNIQVDLITFDNELLIYQITYYLYNITRDNRVRSTIKYMIIRNTYQMS